MSIRSLVLTASTALMLAGAAHAGELRPTQGQTFDLGGVLGVAYYTVEQDGYHVVATLASGAETPIRFIATLGPGQSLTISVPQAVGELPLDFEIARIGEALFVGDPVSARTVDLAHE